MGCLYCSIEIKSKYGAKFCGSSCAAKYNNAVRTPESRAKQQTTIRIRYGSTKPPRAKSGLPRKASYETEHTPYLKVCLSCKIEFTSNRKRKKYCSAECRIVEFDIRRRKARGSVFRDGKFRRRSRAKPFDPNLFLTCEVCATNFYWKTKKKTCSKECQSKMHSVKMSERLRNPEYRKNYGRGKKSFLEKSFYDWLTSKNIVPQIDFFDEHHIVNHLNGKNYWLDFYFPTLNLCIELDGTQHLKTVEKDQLRDDYMKSLDIRVVRVTAREYIKRTRQEEIEYLLLPLMS